MTYIVNAMLNDGDVVRPHDDPTAAYTVVAVHEAKAWIRSLDGVSEMIVDRKIFDRQGVLN